MSVRIASVDGARLRLTGDVAAVLDIPFRAAREGFTLAFSDGTLVRGDYDPAADCCRFAATVEGAAVVSIARAAGGDVLDIAWRVEWLSLASGNDTLCPGDDDQADNDGQLTLAVGIGASI